MTDQVAKVGPMPAIRLRLLGHVDLAGPAPLDTGAVLARPKLVAVLSYLAAALPAGLHRRDTLLGLFWSEMDQEHARGALRQSLYYLRQYLGDDAITTRGNEEVGLAPDHISCDVTLFEQALARGAREEALAVYRGDLLDGFHVGGAPMFERWLDQRRENLQRRAREAVWGLAQDASADGDLAGAGTWARRACQLAPHDEAVLQQVIALLDRLGDRAGAIREYDQFAERLHEDLEVEPAPETRSLVNAIRTRGAVAPHATQSRSGDRGVAGAPHVPETAHGPAACSEASDRPSASIAVLPFANISPDPANEYLSDGFAEEITNTLFRVGGLRVASRTSAFAFKGRRVDVRRIGEELQVAVVLEGSVRKEGSRLRITAQLIQAANGYHLWSERYDREAEDVFAIQDEIARSIVSVLKLLVTDDQKRAMVPVPTARVEAYESYLRGRYFLHRFQGHSVRHAREMFEQAIAVDPDYALAHAGVADCSSFLYMYFDGSAENLVRAHEASRRALELGPGIAETHAARGLALALDSRFAEAEGELKQAITLNPRGFEPHYFYARTCFQQGKLEQAVELFEKACDIREDYQARVLASLALQGLGREAEARAAQEKALEVIGHHHTVNPGDARALTLGAGCLARLGRNVEAIEWCRRALDIDPDDPVVTYAAACVDAILNRRAEALCLLERAIAQGFGAKAWIQNDPDFATLRDDPRFRELVGLA